MIYKICQSCSMPIIEDEEFGTNKDNSKNTYYCSFCYIDGEFVHDVSMSKMIEITLEYMKEIQGDDLDISESRKSLQELFPNLKRWLLE